MILKWIERNWFINGTCYILQNKTENQQWYSNNNNDDDDDPIIDYNINNTDNRCTIGHLEMRNETNFNLTNL